MKGTIATESLLSLGLGVQLSTTEIASPCTFSFLFHKNALQIDLFASLFVCCPNFSLLITAQLIPNLSPGPLNFPRILLVKHTFDLFLMAAISSSSSTADLLTPRPMISQQPRTLTPVISQQFKTLTPVVSHPLLPHP